MLFIQGLLLAMIVFVACAVGKRNGPENLICFYEKEMQQKVLAMGLITPRQMRKNTLAIGLLLTAALTLYPVVCVYGVNDTRGFWPGFWQILTVLMIEGLFDRIVIDIWWVGHTRAWIIPDTEEYLPYIPIKVHIRKWLATVILYPVLAAALAGVMEIILH